MTDAPSIPPPAIDEAVLRASPALDEQRLGTWRLRFAQGYTRRANTVYPAPDDTAPHLDARIAQCEAAYRERHLPPLFRLASFGAPRLEAALTRRGYVRHRTVCEVLFLPLTGPPAPPDSAIQAVSPPEWVACLSHCGELDVQHQAIKLALLAKLPPTAQTAYHRIHTPQGLPAGGGFGVLEGQGCGVFGLATHPDWRGQGLGTRVLRSILGWAVAQGATWAYLQVDTANTRAYRLYRSLGFVPAYSYWYCHRPSGPGPAGAGIG